MQQEAVLTCLLEIQGSLLSQGADGELGGEDSAQPAGHVRGKAPWRDPRMLTASLQQTSSLQQGNLWNGLGHAV